MKLRNLTILAAAAVACGGWAPGNRKLVSWVDQRVREYQPTREQRKIDRIGWAKSIVEAVRLGREHGRPVFLFTYDGSIATGRC